MKIFLHLSRFAQQVLLACLVAAALALTLLRLWILPGASAWRERLQTDIGVMIDETVRIKALSAGMRGFKPELMMRGFHIDNAAQDGPALEFDRLGVGLDMVGSLLAHKPVINRIELEGGRLRLLRQADGHFAVVGLKPSAPPLWLFADGEVRFSDIDLEWVEGTGEPAMALGRAQARLRNQGNRHVLDMRVDLPGKLGRALRLSAEINGNPLSSKAWDGQVYLEAKRLREGAFAESLPVRLRSGELNLQVWANWQDGVFSGATGRLDLDRPAFIWHGMGREGLLELDKLAGWWRWQGDMDRWRLQVWRFAFAQKGKSWPENAFSVAVERTQDSGLQALRVAFDYLRLDEGLDWLGSTQLLDGQMLEKLHSYMLRGEARNGRLLYQADGSVGFCADLTDVSFTPPPDWPGINRFNGRLCGNDRDGRADLNLAQTDLNLPGLYAKPIALDALSGGLAWHRTGGGALFDFKTPPAPVETAPVEPAPDGQTAQAEADMAAVETTPAAKPNPFADSAWHLVGDQIKLAAPGLQAQASFVLDLPAEAGASPTIDLDAQLHEVDAARLRDYLPLPLMSQAAAQWHSNAYKAGTVKQANVLLRGRLADFPFPQSEGLFEARAELEGIELDFNPYWPHVYDAKAKLLFFGPTMFIDTEGGRIGDIPLRTAHTETDSLIGDAWLSIAGGLDTDLAQAMKFLRQTPASHIPQRLSNAFDASGPARLDLHLAIPLGAGEVGVGGLLQLQNDSLALKKVNLKLEGLNGLLAFSEHGLQGKQITANAMAEPILIDVSQQNSNVLFDITGKTSVAALGKVFPSGLWRYADGGFDYRLNLQIPESLDASNAPLRIDLSSDLAGLALKLPAPMAKPAEMKKDSSLALSLRQGGRSSLRLAYGHEGLARLLFNSADWSRLESADVFWGKPQTPASWAPGLGLYLKLDGLDLDAWRRLRQEAGLQGSGLAPRGFDVQIAALSWDGEDRGGLNLTGIKVGDILSGEVDCQYLKGGYSLQNPEFSHATLSLELDRLNLPAFAEDKPGQKPTTPDPADLPTLQIHARHLLRQGTDLGDLELDTERWIAGQNIKRLTLHTENHTLTAKGSWMRQEGRDETKLEGGLDIHDLGRFLTLLGYDKEILRTPTDADFSLAWSGAPQQFSAANVAGELKLKLGRGSVLQMEPGLGRALGMLNLHTLRRLLLLDFSDLFGKGLAYDGMEGTFSLAGGQARTKGFVIDAVAADILIIGRVGLVEHDFDQTISVLPHAVASIPLAGALVGGAAVGAIIDIAHRLVGAEEVNLDSTNYAVTGHWDNPQIKRLDSDLPLEMINRAWAGIKDMSGIGSKGDGQ